ncbi:MAG: hypothetical protein JNM96_02415, partial [Bacteroidia bacterium]|nr:hypothetical protein [Bacteroidia bacterium]
MNVKVILEGGWKWMGNWWELTLTEVRQHCMDKEFQIDNEHLLINKDGIWTLFTNGVERSGQPLFFYKYYSLDEFNIDALRNCYFYLSNPI